MLPWARESKNGSTPGSASSIRNFASCASSTAPRPPRDSFVPAAADIDGVSPGTEIDADEGVADRDRLLDRVGLQIDDVQRSRIEVAAGNHREQLPVGGFVLAVWSSCLWPVAVRSGELAVALSTTPDSTSANAWPARPFQALPRQIPGSRSLRAVRNVPSDAGVCADHVLP